MTSHRKERPHSGNNVKTGFVGGSKAVRTALAAEYMSKSRGGERKKWGLAELCRSELALYLLASPLPPMAITYEETTNDAGIWLRSRAVTITL